MQSPSLRDLNLSSEELKDENMPEDRLLSALISSKPVKKG